jgi:ABC-type branched-subunit amino acid transport system permease subunit
VSTDHDATRMLIGAYVLGGLNETERRTLEGHLPACDECRDELARSAPLTGLLRRAPETFERPASDHAPSTDSPARPAWRRPPLLLVAAVLLAVVALGLGLLLRPGQRDQPDAPTVAFSAAGGYTASGHATLVAKPWGTSVTIALANLPAQGPFTLQVSSADGRTEPACTWAATPTATAAVTGGTSLHLTKIRTITVVDHQGHILATARPANL